MTDLSFDRDFDVTPGEAVALSPQVRRIVVNNPGAFTFKGTSSFIVGRGRVAVIDPGPDDELHFAALLAALRGETVTHILVTHSHADHSPLALRLKQATGATICAQGAVTPPRETGLRLDASIDHGFAPDVTLAEGDAVTGPGWTLEALFTPGHMSNHMCFALREEQALFSGDHVMAWATSVVAPPDGDMGQYFASLRKLLSVYDNLQVRGPRGWGWGRGVFGGKVVVGGVRVLGARLPPTPPDPRADPTPVGGGWVGGLTPSTPSTIPLPH